MKMIEKYIESGIIESYVLGIALPDEVQEYRKDLNKKVNEGIDDGKAAAHGAVDWAKQKADSVFDDLNNLF